MFDDARFYNSLAEDPKSYGKVKCTDSAMYIAIGALDFDDDLLDAIDDADTYLLDSEDVAKAA